MVYKPYRLNLTKTQLTKAVTGKPLRLKNTQLNSGNYIILLHPSNYKLVLDAVKKNKGVTLPGLSPGEIEATKLSSMEGTGIFDFFKKAYDWTKSNWGTIRPIASQIVDAVTPGLAGMANSYAPGMGVAVQGGREFLRKMTGVGISSNGRNMCRRGPNGKFIKNGTGLYLN